MSEVLDIREETLKAVGARNLSEVMRVPPPGFLFENCFRDRSITVFTAPAHRGKTLLMLEMAICLDMELPLFNRFMPLAGRKVFFIGADAPDWDYGLQARKLCIGHGLPPAARDLLDINGIYHSGVTITDPQMVKWLMAWQHLEGANVLFIDSHRATHDKDENSTKEMKQVWDVLKFLRDRGWCIIMSHHAGKLTDILQADVHSGRGSSIISDAADFIYILNKKNRRDTRVMVNMVKGRGAADEEDPFTFFDIESVPSEEVVNGRPLYGLKLVASSEDAVKAILAMLETGPAPRAALIEGLRKRCPTLTKNMGDVTLYRFVDNRLQELRQLGKAKIIERGIWGGTNG